MASSFRGAFRSLVPGWLVEEDGAAVLYSLAIIKDAFVERVRLGLEARFPSRAGESALAAIGAERGIIRGRTEPAAAYARRLKRWRYPRGHRTRGSAFAYLDQIWNFFGGLYVWTIDRRGNRFLRDVTGVESHTHGHDWNWDGALASPRWARFWLVLEPVPEVEGVGPWDTWDTPGGPWGGKTWDELAASTDAHACRGISTEDFRTIKRLTRGAPHWKPAGTLAEWGVLSLSDGAHPSVSASAPGEQWGDWKGRDPALGYFKL